MESITDLLMFDLKVEMSAEPVVEEGLLDITGSLQLELMMRQKSADELTHQ